MLHFVFPILALVLVMGFIMVVAASGNESATE